MVCMCHFPIGVVKGPGSSLTLFFPFCMINTDKYIDLGDAVLKMVELEDGNSLVLRKMPGVQASPAWDTCFGLYMSQS